MQQAASDAACSPGGAVSDEPGPPVAAQVPPGGLAKDALDPEAGEEDEESDLESVDSDEWEIRCALARKWRM
jgi:hypothetical protein